MPRRKYARRGEKSVKDECCNKECKWQGTDAEKVRKKTDKYLTEHICPKCGNNEFYPLLDYGD